MAIDFSLVPPETTSTLIYTGPGVVPLMAAAAAYANLAAEVNTTATQWESVISSLTTQQWTGTGAAAAAAAAGPIVNFLTETAATLEQAATQATASAAAYETTFAAVVPPPVVYANITEHAALVAANPAALGLLTPLILANEAEYAAFWAQDATAMATYQAASLASGTLTPVTPLTTAVSHPGLQSLATTNAVAQQAAPLAAIPVQNTSLLNSIDSALGTPSIFNSVNGAVNTSAWFVGNTIPTAVSLGHTLAGAAVPAAAVGDVVPDGSAAGVVEGTMVRSVTPMAGMGFGGAATAGLGESSLVGKLAVPATWSAAAPTAELASATAPLGGSGWTAAVDEAAPAGMGAPGMPGMVGAGAKGAGAFSGPRYGFKPIVMPKQVVV